MIPDFYDGHYLPNGDHEASWLEVQRIFGAGDHRRQICHMMSGFILAAKRCGFKTVYLFGSFISSKAKPGDLDLLWVYPAGTKDRMAEECQDLLNYGKMKARYNWDMWCSSDNPAVVAELLTGWRMNKERTKQRGIVKIDLEKFEGLIL
jgi:hypothetical protein